MPSKNTALEDIKSRLDIVDILSDYIPLKKAGQNWRGLCPFHSEKTPSFMVSPSKQIYHCFGCGSGGDIFTFLVKYENLSFQEAVSSLAKKAGIPLGKFQKRTVIVEEKEKLLNVHKDALIFYQKILKQNSRAVRYLEDRGITAEARGLFSIGYAPDRWDALLSYLKNRGYTSELIKKSGLSTHGARGYYDTFRNRIIFPIFDTGKEIIAFGGRVLDDSNPKYLNSPETPIFSKSKTLYGISLAKESIRKAGFCILVEGYLDVITAHMYGFQNTVAPLGTALTQEQGKLLKRLTQDIVIVFDGDSSGVKAAQNGIGILLDSGLHVKAFPMPAGEDPDTFLRKKGKEAFGNQVGEALSIVDFLVKQTVVGSGREKNEHLIAREALETIARTPDSVLKGYYVKQLSERLNINELFVREELTRIEKNSHSRGLYRKKDVQGTVTINRSRPMDEIYLLKLALQCPDKTENIFNIISSEDFIDPVIKRIFKKLKVGIDLPTGQAGSSRDGSMNYNDLLSECDEEEKGLITGLSLNADFENPEKILKDCLNKFKARKRQALLHEIQDKIKKAELKKDSILLKNLLIEKQKILRLRETL